MTDYSNLKRLADAAPMAMTMTNGGEEHKALIAFTDEVKRLFGNDVGMARVLITEIEALKSQISVDEKKLDALLNHCEDGECHVCSQIICPHGDGMHFHHDGCPSCAQDEPE